MAQIPIDLTVYSLPILYATVMFPKEDNSSMVIDQPGGQIFFLDFLNIYNIFKTMICMYLITSFIKHALE